MKLLLAVDMEGITGVVLWDHVTPGHQEYQRFRRIMTADVNAAIQGASAGGATEILIADGHSNFTNILIEEMDARGRLFSGSPSPLSMVEGVQTGADAAIFIGYHARIGTKNAILDHTWSNSRVANIWLNGRLAGEFALNASVCGQYGAPVLMVLGDQSVCAEASEWVAGLELVQVKRAISRNAAECLPPSISQPLIREGAERAVKRFLAGRAPAPLIMDVPVTLVTEFIYSDMADRAELLPGSKRLDGRRIEVKSPDMVTAYRSMRAAIDLANR